MHPQIYTNAHKFIHAPTKGINNFIFHYEYDSRLVAFKLLKIMLMEQASTSWTKEILIGVVDLWLLCCAIVVLRKFMRVLHYIMAMIIYIWYWYQLEILMQLQPLVPVHQFDKLPSYYIFAGLLFIPLSQPYLHEYGEEWYNASPRRLCERALREQPKKAGEQLVIIAQVFYYHRHFPFVNIKLFLVASLSIREPSWIKLIFGHCTVPLWVMAL